MINKSLKRNVLDGGHYYKYLHRISRRSFSKNSSPVRPYRSGALRLSINIYPSRPAAIRAYSTSEDGSGLPSLCLCLGNHCHLIQASPRGMLLLQIYNQRGGCQTGSWHQREGLDMGRQSWGRVRQWLTPGVC